MMRGEIESISVVESALDVLAQQVVATVAVEDVGARDLEALVRRAAPYRELPREAFDGVLDMLSGRYPSTAFADLTPRIVWDRDKDVLSARRGARMVALMNGGTIADRGSYGVYLGEDGVRLGELDEEMVYETTPGEVFALGASSWRVERITRDRVIVTPAPGELGKLPFWRGDGPGRPVELGRALGQFVRELSSLSREEAEQRLEAEYCLDSYARGNLLSYLDEQREATGVLPSDRMVVVERFRDELGDQRVCILTPFGARLHAPWALALEAILTRDSGFRVQSLWSDDGIVLRFADTDEAPNIEDLFPEPEDLDDLIVDQLAQSALFAGQFRENAGRALLMPKRRPGGRTPLWLQRRKASELLAVAQRYPSFPVVMETYRSCLRDIFDVPSLKALLGDIRSRRIQVRAADTTQASPFATSLVFGYVAAYLYEGDTPVAERRAQALSLDRRLLGQLLGENDLRALLDTDVIVDVESELQGLAEHRRALHEDGLHDLLRRVGDLTADEIAARSEGDPAPWIESLLRARRIVALRIGGESRYVVVEEVALFRDALGAVPPAGMPIALLTAVEDAMTLVVERYARTHGPFLPEEVARRYPLPLGPIRLVLDALESKGVVVRGELRPAGSVSEWCHVEILRRIKRRTLAKLRHEVAPVERARVADFLPAWHGVGEGTGLARLQDAIVQLEGLPLPFAELERAILPSRVRDYRPAMLYELGATGWLVWAGSGALGSSDGWVELYRREHVAELLVQEPPAELGPLHACVLETLARQGASFFASLLEASGGARADDLLAALQDLVWSGLVTNDTFAALRAAGAPKSASPRVRARAQSQAGGGRWSLVADLCRAAPSETERQYSLAVKLLERHGIVCREVAAVESLPGGFAALYRVYRAREEAGRVRRGYFIEDLGGAQFAYAGAVDRLRARRDDQAPRAVVLSAVDPANPYGWLLPWPVAPDADPKPRRVAGAAIVLVAGEPVLYLAKSGTKMLTLPGAASSEYLAVAARALESIAARRRGKYRRVERIDGGEARQSQFAHALTSINFTATYRGLEREVR
jgi:ATP-dependent Lhr-like helicase